MASLNKVFLIGNMVADPELKQTAQGVSVCSFRIGVQRRFAKEGQPSADFIDIVAWRQSAEFVCRYFRKGKPILVCGQIQTRTWADQQGVKRYAVEVVADEVSFVESAQSAQNTQNAQGAQIPPHAPSVQNSANTTPTAAYMPQSYSQQEMGMQFDDLPQDDMFLF